MSGIQHSALRAAARRQGASSGPTPLQQLAGILAALGSAPASDKLAGKDAAEVEFRSRIGVSARASRSRRRRSTLLTSLLSARAAATVAIAALGIGGAATAAYAGKLPSSVQQFAHDTVGAPAAHRSHHDGRATGRPGTPVGPDATAHAAYGLCTAYAHSSQHGNASHKSVAFRNLVTAAGGADKVAGYCSDVPHPGASHAPSSHLNGKPSSLPHHPTGKPTSRRSHPTGKPSGLPNPQRSGARGTAGL